MKKAILFIAIGIALGYSYGWRDAQRYDENVVTRVVHRVGGSNREHFQADVDGKMDRLQR